MLPRSAENHEPVSDGFILLLLIAVVSVQNEMNGVKTSSAL